VIRTIASIFISLGLIIGAAFYETTHVKAAFNIFESALVALYEKAEAGEATFEDGSAIEALWEEKKKTLHTWVAHTAIQEVDYQLYEAVGCLYVRDYDSAMPKIEVLLGMCQNIPQSYTLNFYNIF